MKVIILSDIHGNLEALKKALEYVDMLKGDKRIICLGDIVGYGPNPIECLELVQSRTDKICMGNHDYASFNTDNDNNMSPNALKAIKWTRSIIDKKSIEAISKFPIQIEEQNILYVHSSPHSPELWDYIHNSSDANYILQEMDHALCFIGHTHIPVIFSDYEIKRKGEVKTLSKEGKTIVNVGSVGQPRDRSTLLSFAVFDDVKWSVETVRLSYDYKKTISKMKTLPLPEALAKRLACKSYNSGM